MQGSRSRPYRVRIGLQAFGKAQWAGLERELAGNAWYLATLLAGEMPDDIEDVFAGVGLSLFPASAGELSRLLLPGLGGAVQAPRRHVYLLAESFDDDPFRILIRGPVARDDAPDQEIWPRLELAPRSAPTSCRGGSPRRRCCG